MNPLCLAPLLLIVGAEPARPLALHPDNPHYLLFRGKPTILLTSGEHYGAVLNRDFDYRPYLDELKAHGFNLTRTFSGTYFEVPGSFNIVDNTLAPAPDRYQGPWARSGNRFDLTKWDPAYVERLKGFVSEAGKRGIVVELVLFCTLYDDKLWNVSPFRAANNVNGIGTCGRREVFALKEDALTAVQEATARKIVTELKDFDNVYFEVCNEPYFVGVTAAWQDRMIAVITDAEKDLPARHLIAQNIANGSAKVVKPNPATSIFNFHYATPPETVAMNYNLNRPIGDDETGFRGTADLPYRTEAWNFLIAGGAIFSNLDYSYTCKHPDGTANVTTSPGGGGPELRTQLAILKGFMDDFEFMEMKPDPAVLRSQKITPATLPPGSKPPSAPTARILAEPGRQYAVYVRGGIKSELTLVLPAGRYRAEWLNPRTGKVDKAEDLRHESGNLTLASPDYVEDIAVRILLRKDD
jgi:hypothetical protein